VPQTLTIIILATFATAGVCTLLGSLLCDDQKPTGLCKLVTGQTERLLDIAEDVEFMPELP
jgi:hypothetical protein